MRKVREPIYHLLLHLMLDLISILNMKILTIKRNKDQIMKFFCSKSFQDHITCPCSHIYFKYSLSRIDFTNDIDYLIECLTHSIISYAVMLQ